MNVKISAQLIAVALVVGTSGIASATHKAGHKQNNPDAPGQDRVCLVTFKDAAAKQSQANVGVVSAKMLPRKAAQSQESDRSRIYTYRNTQATCECLNNPRTRPTCQG